MDQNTQKALSIILNQQYSPQKPMESLLSYASPRQFQTFKPGDTMIYQKDDIKYFHFLLNGRASVINQISVATYSTVDYIEPPHIIGLIEFLNNTSTYTAYVVADTPCTLFRVPVLDYIQLIQKDSALCYRTLHVLGSITTHSMHKAELNSTFHPKDVLGHYFYLQAQHRRPYVCPLTRKMLADEQRLNLRTLYRYLDSMKQDGYLTIVDGRIIIEEKHYLKLEERYGNIIL